MRATEITNKYVEGGKNYVTASIFSDDKPSTMPTTGADIKGLADDEYLAPASSIFTKNGDIAFLGEDGTWGDWL